MNYEIEHKYLVINEDYKKLAIRCEKIIQGYIDRTPEHVVRVRKRADKYFLTIKGKNNGASRPEFEYEISKSDFEGLLSLCSGPILRKNRWIVPFEGMTWEVDEFLGSLSGMTLAEIELNKRNDAYTKPPFIGKNVTGQPQYYNSNLLQTLHQK